MKKELVCILCPNGCPLVVRGEGEALLVSGNTCPRGHSYAISEVTHPMRTLTALMKLEGGKESVISVKTNKEIPKEKIFSVIEEINKTHAVSPVAIGDVLIKNVLNLSVDVVATREG